VTAADTGLDATPFARFGAIHRAAVRAEWDAAREAGLEIVIRDEDGILFGAAPGIDSRVYNRALGVAEQPVRLPDAIAFFAEHGVDGEVSLDPADTPPGAEATIRLEAYLDRPSVVDASPVDGLVIRQVGRDAADDWMATIVEAYEPDAATARLWRSMAGPIAANARRRLQLAELDGRVVAASSIQLTDAGAWISWAGVVPSARGRGLQRALIAARAALSAELGCDWIAAWALAGAHSSANLAAAGLHRIGERASVRSADLVAARSHA
jgi:GNAT superfamily N-acetyltransferase